MRPNQYYQSSFSVVRNFTRSLGVQPIRSASPQFDAGILQRVMRARRFDCGGSVLKETLLSGISRVRPGGRPDRSSHWAPPPAGAGPDVRGFESGLPREVFEYLAKSFVNDYMRKRLSLENSGWRNLAEAARDLGLSANALYGKQGRPSQTVVTLMKGGLVESRTFLGTRSRGGAEERFRIAYERELVKEYVSRRVVPWEKKAGPLLAKLDVKRIAVLPFVSISPDPNDEYFADGLTEEMIGRLSMVGGLEVIARTSVMNYKKEKKGASQIGRELKAGTLMEGSVRKSGDKIRVSAQLIDANTEHHLWLENHDGMIGDIFALQREIAEKVATSLELKLTAENRRSPHGRETPNPEAHFLVLKGQFYSRRWDEDSLTTAIGFFNEALSHDPGYASAYCGLSRAHALLGFLDIRDPKKAYGNAKEYARKALELDARLPEAHFVHAVSLLNDYDWDGRAREFRKAIELDPNFAEAYGNIAYDYGYKKEWGECLKFIHKQLELDPLSVESAGNAGTWCLYAGRLDEAIEHLKDALELDPVNWFYLSNLGLAHMKSGMMEEGLAEMRRSWEMSSVNAGDLAYAYIMAGKAEEARKILNSLIESRSRRRVSALTVAGIYSSLGEKDDAFRWLEKAYKARSGYLPALNGDFVFENLRDDPRFRKFIEKIGLATPR